MTADFGKRRLILLAALLAAVTIAHFCWSSVLVHVSAGRLTALSRPSNTTGEHSRVVTAQSPQSESTSRRTTTTGPREAPLLQMHNTVEDAKLQHYIAKERHKVKAVIYYLAEKAGVEELVKSIELLHDNFNKLYRYPLVIFHEADFLPMIESTRRVGLLHETKSSFIFFQQVDLSVPEWHIKKFGQPSQLACASRSVGYRSMCRFQAKQIYEQKILRHFDYYWRLDDDSEINSQISFDVFDVLRTGQFSYGFVITTIDSCAHELYRVAEDYMKSKGITPTFFHKLKRDEIFYNNFEVSSLKFWRSQLYRDFIDHIDSLGGIYTHRWGDAPIKTLALSMFVPLREIYRYRGISYKHPIGPTDETKFLA